MTARKHLPRWLAGLCCAALLTLLTGCLAGRSTLPQAAERPSPEPITGDYALLEITAQDRVYLIDDEAERSRLFIALQDAVPLKEMPAQLVTIVQDGQATRSVAVYDGQAYPDWDETAPTELLQLLAGWQDETHAAYRYTLAAQTPAAHDALMDALLADEAYRFYDPSPGARSRYSSLTAYYTFYGEKDWAAEAEALGWHTPIGALSMDAPFVPLRDWLAGQGLLYEAREVKASHFSPGRGAAPPSYGRRVQIFLQRPLTDEEQATLSGLLQRATDAPPYRDPVDGAASGRYTYDAVSHYPIALLSPSPVTQEALARVAARYGLALMPETAP